MTILDHVEFATDDGLNALFVALGHELEHPEHIAVVSDGHGGHVVGLGFFEQFLDIRSSVEQ